MDLEFPDDLAARLPEVRRGARSDVEWVELVWSGKLAELGRLQFDCRRDDRLGVHVPETGPLLPEACDASDVLPAESNLVRFQRRFELENEGEDANGDVLRFVFHTYDTDLDKLEPATTLERALVARMRAGAQWRNPTGRLSL